MRTMPNDISLRSPAPDEMAAFFRPLADAFGEEFSDAEVEWERDLTSSTG